MMSILYLNIQGSINKWTDKDKDVNEEFVAGVVTKIKNNEITLDEYLVSPTIKIHNCLHNRVTSCVKSKISIIHIKSCVLNRLDELLILFLFM